ncbi:hypothetical protein, partial [Pseudomonas aeruginosa]
MTMTFQHDDLPLALYSAAQVRDLDARLIACLLYTSPSPRDIS